MKKIIERLLNNSLLRHFLTHFQSAEMGLSGIAVAYYLILTIFPTLILIANIFPYFRIDTVDMLNFLKENLPVEFYGVAAGVVTTIFDQPATNLVWLSILTGLWSMSKGFFFLQKAINKAYKVEEERDYLFGRLMGGLSGVVLIGFLLVAVLFSTFGKAVLTLFYSRFGLQEQIYQGLMSLVQPTVSLIFFIALMMLYYLMPNVRITKKRYILPGSLFTSLVLLVTTNLFASYINTRITSLENVKILGSVTIFVLMFWFTLFARVIIFGAILNATYQAHREGGFIPRKGYLIDLTRLQTMDKE